MNFITQACLSAILFYGFASGMNQEEFSTKFAQFKSFNLKATNQNKFQERYQELLNHVAQDGKINRIVRSQIKGIYVFKMKTLWPELNNMESVVSPSHLDDKVKNKILFQPLYGDPLIGNQQIDLMEVDEQN